MQADIQATYTISRAEYLQAMRRHYRRTSKYVQDIGPMMITSGVIMLESEKGRVLGWIQISLGLLLLLMLIYAVWLMPVLMYRNQPKLQSEYHLTFDKSVIRLQTDQIQSQLQWSFYQLWQARPLRHPAPGLFSRGRLAVGRTAATKDRPAREIMHHRQTRKTNPKRLESGIIHQWTLSRSIQL